MTASVERDLYKFHGQHARLTGRVQREVCLVVHGQNGNAVRKHVDHPLAASHLVRHVLDEAIGRIVGSEIGPLAKAKIRTGEAHRGKGPTHSSFMKSSPS
jgi:hypothetical protein